MATIIKPDEERPVIALRENVVYVSEFEKETEEKILRDEKQKKKDTLMTMSLDQIVENTINVVAMFGHEYKKHIYQVSQDHKIRGVQETLTNKLKLYLLALVNYLGEKDNILYVGIILCFVSIIIYFFNISTS